MTLHKPRFPLRWRHRLMRMMKPRTLQGLSIQLVLATGLLIAALSWSGYLERLYALLAGWLG
ncbi:hypothetical protein [Rhodoplanes elegans]|uniref:hypothetical protein n=1 Tax=Rhodoplanes elegans TaxID=29408 RepID=UPI0011B94B7B|nr:hypothetical protein [Rhodoplanes elegans]